MKSILAACLLAASTFAFAQAPSGDAAKPPRKERFDCSQAKDPKTCEERRAKMKAMHEKASKACEGKQGDEHRACMSQQFCAQAKDPAQCQARLKDRADKRKQRMEDKKAQREKSGTEKK
jgi:hypothetical protein